jgi:Holliday junction DNA helicase RuvB
VAREPVIRGGEAGDDAGKGGEPPRLLGTPDPNDPRGDDELRPQRLADVIGQRDVVRRLQIMLNATRKRQEPLGHLLFDGPPGLGKTTFATVIPKELGVESQTAMGPSLMAPRDMLPYLTNASHGSVLFIDEIHRMAPAVEEFIYPVMEDFRVDIALGEGLNARTISMKLKPFTIIGATTRSGLLTAPLRDRFVNREHLDYYTAEDLAVIVRRSARILKTEITPEATQLIAARSRGTPRIANHLLRWSRDYADSEADGNITTAIAEAALRMRDVDVVGLDKQDRRYLEILIVAFGGGPAGLQAIAHSMNVSADTLEDEIEPFLLRCQFIQRTPRGRMATAAAYVHLHLNPPVDPKQGTLF